MKPCPAFLSVALLFCGLTWAQEGPKDEGDSVRISKVEVARINAMFRQAAEIIDAQKKEIDHLKSITGCT